MRISRLIGREDMSFYEHAIVEATARSMSRLDDGAWKSATPARRTRWRDRALDALTTVLGERSVVERLPLLSANLATRL
jgi:hypothetical protein